MRENVGRVDRIVRFVVGPGLLAYGLTLIARRRALLGAAVSLIAGSMVTETALTKTCPMNKLLGINTKRFDRSHLLQQASEPEEYESSYA